MVAALIAVALLAYGIASEAVLFPYEQNKGIDSIGRLLGRAYWEIHGTLNLNEMTGGTSMCLCLYYCTVLYVNYSTVRVCTSMYCIFTRVL